MKGKQNIALSVAKTRYQHRGKKKGQIIFTCQKIREIKREKGKGKGLCGLLKTPSEHTAELLNADAFALDFTAGFVLFVRGHLDNNTGARLVDLPVADFSNKLLKSFTTPQVKPCLKHIGVDLAEGLADLDGNTNAHELFETGDIGNKVCVQIVRVQSRPELGVLCRLEKSGEAGEFLNGFDKVGGLRSSLCFCKRLGVCGKESKAEREGRRGEDSEGLSENVGHNLGLEEMRVELVSIQVTQISI